MDRLELIEKLKYKYDHNFQTTTGFGEDSLFAKISDLDEDLYEDFLSDIDEHFWTDYLGYILDEEELSCIIFFKKDEVVFDNSLINAVIKLFDCLDSIAAWGVHIVEVDEKMNQREINVLNWYFGELINSTNLSEEEKEEKKNYLEKIILKILDVIKSLSYNCFNRA